MNHGEEVNSRLFEASEDAARFLEPSDEAFYHVASTVQLAIELRMMLIIGLLSDFGDHCLNLLRLQLLSDPIAAICLVAGDCLRLNQVLECLI